jgi:hypothetical protein
MSGIPPQIVPLSAVSSQTLFVTLNNQPCQINIYSKDIMVPVAGGIATSPPNYAPISPIFCDLYVNGAIIILGVLCLNQVLIVRDVYLGFIGDLAFYDTQGTDDPLISGLGQRWQLVYWPPGTYTLGLSG